MYLQVRKDFRKKSQPEKSGGNGSENHRPGPVRNSAPVKVRRISVEKAIIRFVARGLLDYEEAKAAFAFISLVSGMKSAPVSARSLIRISRNSVRRNGAARYGPDAALSSRRLYECWCRAMLVRGYEPLTVLDYALNGTPFSRLDKQSEKPTGWAKFQFVAGMKIFRHITQKSALLTYRTN